MSKKSGFAVKITAFIEADPKDAQSMKDALELIDMKLSDMAMSGVIIVKQSSRFMLSALVLPEDREVPDGNGSVMEPPVEGHTMTTADLPASMVEPYREVIRHQSEQITMPAIPPAMRRT